LFRIHPAAARGNGSGKIGDDVSTSGSAGTLQYGMAFTVFRPTSGALIWQLIGFLMPGGIRIQRPAAIQEQSSTSKLRRVQIHGDP
jgi:hypothetical protein